MPTAKNFGIFCRMWYNKCTWYNDVGNAGKMDIFIECLKALWEIKKQRLE